MVGMQQLSRVLSRSQYAECMWRDRHALYEQLYIYIGAWLYISVCMAVSYNTVKYGDGTVARIAKIFVNS